MSMLRALRTPVLGRQLFATSNSPLQRFAIQASKNNLRSQAFSRNLQTAAEGKTTRVPGRTAWAPLSRNSQTWRNASANTTTKLLSKTQKRNFNWSWSRRSQAAGAKVEEPLSLSGRLKKLGREYGWSAFGVYMALSVLDFPFCFLLVKWAGTDRIGKSRQTEQNVAGQGDLSWAFPRTPSLVELEIRTTGTHLLTFE